MSQDPTNSFDDPTLQAALRSALGRERAPADLRARISAALDEVQASVAPHRAERRLLLFRSPMMGLAAAALVVIVVGLAIKFYGGGSGGGTKLVAVLPKPIAEAMVQVHDSTNVNDNPTLAANDATARQKALSTELGYAAIVPALGDGWSLKDAKTADINGFKSAQATYTRSDGQSISLFSIPANKAYSPEDGSTYEMSVDKHAIAGFVRNATMYCAVGSEGVKMDDLKKLTDALSKS